MSAEHPPSVQGDQIRGELDVPRWHRSRPVGLDRVATVLEKTGPEWIDTV